MKAAETRGVLIQGNHLHHMPAEAIDIKAQTRDIQILDNHAHDIEVKSQGAITLGLNEINFPDGNYRVERNIIHDVTSREHNGAAIWIGHGNTRIANNIIWNIPNEAAIVTSTDFANPSARTVEIFHNTIWATPKGAFKGNAINSGGGATSNGVHILKNNLAADDSMGAGNHVAKASDFVKASGNMDAGGGPGSGLRPLAGSSPVGAGSQLSQVTHDFDGTPRPQKPTAGAFEPAQ